MDNKLKDLLKLSQKELQDAKEIYKLTKKIEESIKGEEEESLNQNVSIRESWIEQAQITKKKVLKNISAICKEYSIKNIKELGEEVYPPIGKVLSNIEEMKNTYISTYALEKQNTKNIELLIDKYKKEIKGVTQGRQAYAAYGKTSNGASMMIDKVIKHKLK